VTGPSDAFGELLLAQLEGRPGAREIVERDDGFIDANAATDDYLER
jgi:hypothetical protein